MDPKQAIQIGTEIFLEPSGNLVPDSKGHRNPVALSYMKKKGRSVAPVATSSHSITIARVGHTSI